MAITESERNEFVGAHLKVEVKEALYALAKVKKISVSALISKMVEECLKGSTDIISNDALNAFIEGKLGYGGSE